MCPSTGSSWTPVRDELVKTLAGRAPTARIVELAKNGMTRQEIAETVGCSLSMVGHAMNEHGNELGITKYWASEETERLIELKRAGYTNRAIGADIGRSKEQVERRINWLRKRGFDI